MKATIRKLTMLFVVLSVLLAGAGCGHEADILYSEETEGTAAELSCGTEDIAGASDDAADVKTDGAQIPDAEAADGAQETGADAQSADTAGKGEAPADGSAGSSGDTADGSAARTVFVHVCGAVNDPGVYELAADARIYEAVAAASGCRADASADSLNLAQAVVDGMRVYVPTVEEAKAAAVTENTVSAAGSPAEEQWVSGSDSSKAQEDAGAGTQDSAAEEKVSINTAAKEELMTLPGIGEAKAESIIAYREEHGAFQSIEEIMQISGIKESVFSKIKEKIKL